MDVESDGNAEEAEGTAILDARIREASDLLARVNAELAHCDGRSKLAHKISAELRFLIDLKDSRRAGLRRYTDTSNVVHFRGVVDAARRHAPCTAVCKAFSLDGARNSAKLEVDLVANGGAKWVKVISRSARGLAMGFVGAGGGSGRSVTEQAEDYAKMASSFPHYFATPSVVFEFTNGVPDVLAEQIESLGIAVIGSRVPLDQLVKIPEDSDSDADIQRDESAMWNWNASAEEARPCGSDVVETLDGDAEVPAVNLDVTAVFALVSSLTHEGGAEHHFNSRILNAQAAKERKKPALQPLLKIIAGKKMIMCRTAYDSLQRILGTVAGPEEKRRAVELLKNVTVVDDYISERAARLRTTDKISQRSKIIFGSGDYYKAVTVSANRHFLSAASHQGIHFAAILHEPRALSEQKQPAVAAAAATSACAPCASASSPSS